MKTNLRTFIKHTAKDFHNQSVNPPVVRASTIIFKNLQEIEKAEKKYLKNPRSGNFNYGRQGTPTTYALQKVLQEMEECYKVYLTPTGFGAVFLAVLSVVQPGDEILVTDSVYSPTRLLTQDYLKKFNIKSIFYNPLNLNDLKNKVSKKTKLIFVENPGSNTFEFQDLKKIITLAKKNNIFTAIDNTWATPYLLKPIKLGFDMSIVSATKYYSGHSDVMGGSLAINKKVFKLVEPTNRVSGLRLSPDEAYLVLRGIRTLDVRLDKHHLNALKVANFLSKHKKILNVYYPYKKKSQNYKMWKKYYSGASGLMGLKVKSKNKKTVKNFINSLKLFGYGYSWGGFESLALYQSQRQLGARNYTNLKKNEHIIRLHIGLEDPKDIINDLKQGLKKIK
ncbi:PLP-dependent aspartate aminotransferase family protein [Candidatus Pelagibacter sp.]|nr:PLP-dependent aspartate aminotransferase family protein [Candidatus Pelagibacter sp.]